MSKIQWTNETWNPIIGCTKISEGCKECYAEKMAFRLSNMINTAYYCTVLKKGESINNGELSPPDSYCISEWNGKTSFIESQLKKPLKWKKPRMIFVCSMGDLFHESVPFEWIDKVMAVIGRSQQHTFQILTKRPERMREYFNQGRYDEVLTYASNLSFYPEGLGGGISNPKDMSWWKNVLLGVTAENQEQANKRIPILLDIPAAKRFVSCEPLLSYIDINKFNYDIDCDNCGGTGSIPMKGGGKSCPKCLPSSLGRIEVSPIHWVIAGPETGPRKRPMKKEWIENIYNQCKRANVPFFDKKDTLELNLNQFPK